MQFWPSMYLALPEFDLNLGKNKKEKKVRPIHKIQKFGNHITSVYI
jgi:hypothetical protein